MKVPIGQKFNRLTVLEDSGYKYYGKNGKYRIAKCRCDCGNEVILRLTAVKKGTTKSCGCLQLEAVTKHGDAGTYLYDTWLSMKKRTNPNNKDKNKYYSHRGIEVCDEWLNDYQKFKNYVLNHLGERPEKYSLDRINNDGNYEPGNVRWASSKTQSNNRSVSKCQQHKTN